MKTLFFAILLAAFSITAFAQETTDQELKTSVTDAPATSTPAWKASLTSYYYDFQGTQEARGDLYSFDNSTLNMQLVTVQYQYSPSWTFQILAQHIDNYVETNVPVPGGEILMKDRSKGLGDTYLSAITPLWATSEAMLLADVGVSLPTGDINQKTDLNPQQNNAYNMQNGSGTFDAVTGLTALSFQGPVQLGSHLTGIFRNGKNANGYRLGNLYRVDAWADYNTKWGLTPRLVGYYKHKDAISGEDVSYRRRDNFSEFYYHNQINWDVSAALKYTQNVGPVSVVAEAGVPVTQGSQNVDDVVVSTDYYGSLSFSGTF